jgi:anti-anti-sigma regulatory factor
MAIFGKPPAKKPQATKSSQGTKREAHVVSARELAAQAASRKTGKPLGLEPLGETSQRGASIIDWSTAPKAIEVAQANPGLCAVLENAALSFANGQDAAARELLEQGIQSDADTKLSPLAWLALFDLLERADERAAFDQLAMQFVLQFERSAPSWNERTKPPADDRGGTAGGYIAVTGKLSSGSSAQLEGLKRALEKCVPRARIDLSSVTGFDDAGARLLARDLARARSQRMELAIQRPEKLVATLEAAVAQGREGGEGAWLLSLELLQWQREQEKFDERAVDFAVTFELSPPSWEPPPRSGTDKAAAGTASDGAAVALAERPEPAADRETLAWSGVLAGATPAQITRLADFASRNAVVQIDMTDVERVDFIFAGALFNAITRVEAQGKAVQILGASPIVRALLLLIGISPRHFVKKAD